MCAINGKLYSPSLKWYWKNLNLDAISCSIKIGKNWRKNIFKKSVDKVNNADIMAFVSLRGGRRVSKEFMEQTGAEIIEIIIETIEAME